MEQEVTPIGKKESPDSSAPKKRDIIDALTETRTGILFLLSGRLADAASTITFVEKLGLDAEQNPLLRFLMREYGTLGGNAIHTAGIMAVAIPTAYAINKVCEKVELKNLKGGNFLVYALGGMESYGVSLLNLAHTYL